MVLIFALFVDKVNAFGTVETAALGTGSMHERAVRAAEFADVCLRERVIGVFLQPLQFLEKVLIYLGECMEQALALFRKHM